MKKLSALILVLCIVFALCSCKKEGNIKNSSIGTKTESTIIVSSNESANSSKIESTLSKSDSKTELNSSSSASNGNNSDDNASVTQNSSLTSVMEKEGKWTTKYITKKDLTFSTNKELIYLNVILSPPNDAYMNFQHGILLEDLIPPDRELVRDSNSGIKSDEFEGEKYYYFTGSSKEISSIEESGSVITLTMASSEGKAEKIVLERKNENTIVIKEADNAEIVGKELMFLPQ